MNIGAIQKTTLLDFPGRPAAVLFARGCNFRCPYCHNPGLVKGEEDPLAEQEVLDFLTRRKKLLQGAVISGGEPCLQETLPEFCADLKGMGYAIKLDSNGSRPDMLEGLLRAELLDYVALDLKADPRGYPAAIIPGGLGDALARSVKLVREYRVEYEFRTTCVAPFVDADKFPRILEALEDGETLFLQAARLDTVLNPAFFGTKGRALTTAEIHALRDMALARGIVCETR